MAHWLEQAGISTVVIGLIRLHLEKMLPPRAMWVPFELGRPVGGPDNPEFQREVLHRALALVETADKQILIDFDKDDPGATADPDWQGPALESHVSVVEECQALKPEYQRYCVIKSRTSIGVAKASIPELAELIDHAAAEGEFKSLRDDISARLMFRFALDDLKAYYVESALEGQGSPSSQQVYDWLWNDTLLGSCMQKLRAQLMASDDQKNKDLAAKFITPHRWRI